MNTTATDTKQTEAIDCATRASTYFGLPQTVYRNAESGGWWHTNALARVLDSSEVAVTLLPANYFN